MEGSDVCFAPVLTLPEAIAHPHNRARGVFVEIDGVAQPAPAPRFSRTQPATRVPAGARGRQSAGDVARVGLRRSRGRRARRRWRVRSAAGGMNRLFVNLLTNLVTRREQPGGRLHPPHH